MILTEEMIKNLPIITDEELNEIRIPTDQLIELTIEEFNRERDRIDSEQ